MSRRKTCRLCRKRLKEYERPEGICDACLRRYTPSPWPDSNKEDR
jgi:hypothetical protein